MGDEKYAWAYASSSGILKNIYIHDLLFLLSSSLLEERQRDTATHIYIHRRPYMFDREHASI